MAGETAALARDPIVLARFWSKVNVGRESDCWEWQKASRNEHGYGIFRPTKTSGVVKAHRFALSAVSDLGGEEVVRHTCDNPPCCNPKHLVSGTQAENVADMHERGRRKYESRLDGKAFGRIIELSRRGELHRNIAHEFSISQSHVSNILNGKVAAALPYLEGEKHGR